MSKDMISICPHSESCGGCFYQGTPYSEQLEKKNELVKRFIEDHDLKIGEYHDILPSPAITSYRNRMDFTFGNLVIDGELNLGMHRKKSYISIVSVPECMLVDRDYNLILKAVQDWSREMEYPFYHKKSRTGLLRNLVVRKGERTGELLVNILTTSQGDFDDEAFKDLILSLDTESKVVGIMHTIYDGKADMVACDELRLLYGRDHYFEEIMGLQFKVTAFSFFQTNVQAVERLYSDALDLIPDLEGKTVFDLYCGTGTISQALALKAKKVVGIELVAEAAAAAEVNAKLNGLENISFIAGDVLEALDYVTAKPDIIVVDPPRAGIHPKALKKILAYGVKEILYISCNPKTLTHDLAVAQEFGYRIEVLKSYDNFPFTKHVESVVLMSRVDK